MFHLLHHRKLLQVNIRTIQIKSLQNPFLKCHSQTNASSLPQYLQNSCGLSPEKALIVSKTLNHKTPRNPDSVLSLFKSHGFLETHIKSVITKVPRLLFFAAESCLRPKIQFFKEKGLSESDIVDLVISDPTILSASLEKRIRPSFDFLRSILGTDALVIKVLKRSMFRFNLHKSLVPNVVVLKNCGVADHRISKLLVEQPTALIRNPDLFDGNVKMVQEMGFNSSTHRFMEALRVMASLSRLTWDMKAEVYRSFGWSDEEMMCAFRKNPCCMKISVEKISRGLDFFMRELGWSCSCISNDPKFLLFSMEKRILPRHRFVQFLASKGLIENDKKFIKANFIASEKGFLENYVMKYQTKVPEILKVYESMIGLKGLDIKFGEECQVGTCWLASSTVSSGEYELGMEIDKNFMERYLFTKDQVIIPETLKFIKARWDF